MNRAVLISLGVCVVAIAAIILVQFFFGRAAQNAKRSAWSPSGELHAFALPFRGTSPHALDGALRVFLQDSQQTFLDRHQTKLPTSYPTRLEWVAGTVPPTFRVFDELGTRMLWQVEDQKAVCVQGQELLAPDPYDQ